MTWEEAYKLTDEELIAEMKRTLDDNNSLRLVNKNQLEDSDAMELLKDFVFSGDEELEKLFDDMLARTNVQWGWHVGPRLRFCKMLHVLTEPRKALRVSYNEH